MIRVLGFVLFFLPSVLGAQGPAPFAGEEREVDWIGFAQFEEISRVFVRTDESVAYRIDISTPKTVVLTLENTRLRTQNDANHLDTRYFVSPVKFIQPVLIEVTSKSVKITIYLRHAVTFSELQRDNFLALDFERN